LSTSNKDYDDDDDDDDFMRGQVSEKWDINGS